MFLLETSLMSSDKWRIHHLSQVKIRLKRTHLFPYFQESEAQESEPKEFIFLGKNKQLRRGMSELA